LIIKSQVVDVCLGLLTAYGIVELLFFFFFIGLQFALSSRVEPFKELNAIGIDFTVAFKKLNHLF
jgi:hypothetical protein